MDPPRCGWHPPPVISRLALVLACSLALAASARGEDAPWQAGDRLEPFELADPHGVAGRIDEGVRLVLFTADMDGGKLVQAALEDAALQDLAAHGAVYIADISRMPALVTRVFAMPSIRRRPYRTLLDPGPGPSVRMPREAGKVTLLELDALAVKSVRFADAPEAVASAVRAGLAPGAP